MQNNFEINQIVDASHLSCPMPLLKLRQTLNQMPIGHVVQLLATDPNSSQDIQLYCQKSGQLLLQYKQESINNTPTHIFYIQKTK